jgi:hypothetical protein
LTLYWLGRAAGVSRLAAVYALGLFILFNLPPFNYFWGFITPYPIAPFLLVTAGVLLNRRPLYRKLRYVLFAFR